MRKDVTAWGALVLGAAWAGLGNVAHANGDPLAMAWSGALPVALLVSLVLVLQRRGTWHAWAGAALVAAVSFSVSYVHQYALLIAHGEPQFSAILGPLAPDGLVAVATGVIMTSRVTKLVATKSGDQVTKPVTNLVAPPVTNSTTKPDVVKVTKPDDQVGRVTKSPGDRVVLAADVTRLRADGVTWSGVADQLGVSVTTAQRAVKSPTKN